MKHQVINSKSTHYSGITYYGDSFKSHFHNSYEMICVLSGNITVSVNGQCATLKDNDFFLISPCMVHDISQSENAVYFVAIITPDYIPDFYEAHKSDAAYLFSEDAETFAYIKKYLVDAKSTTKYQLKACFYMLLSFVGEENKFSVKLKYDFIYAVNTYIANHFTEPIRRAQLASYTGYEEHYFSELFRKSFKMGLRKYINIYRISYAVYLLQKTDDKISRIALDSGFTSVKEFNNVFMFLMNETPSQYRKNHR